ncbi:hypothetical protein GGTG_14347 [Gaeumannomyces tritici R3-111a-1]|uniref:Chromo domain-containing protein n=1 Tax=Gaeumannomyces tritici (strain R3-111a-1) TaxID=644352 RepID=J3PL95_GAET3|nr:hypothetical protein GGTG_14347 [Gaeumannomyces tritici R3-111a-1]EJT68074.1 hypothetical protein GGTG_14347 [Gaeumannomyces tritici R3-111a-1]
MPSHAFSPRAHAAPPPVVGLIYNRGPAAATSFDIVITAATAFRQVTQNTAILSFWTTEESRMRIVLFRPPARSKLTFSTTSVVIDVDVVAIPTRRRTILPLREVTPSKARMRMSSGRHEGSAAGSKTPPESAQHFQAAIFKGVRFGRETIEAAFASFEEWPLEAVLKLVWVDGAATFQVEFTWNPRTNHGRNDRAPEIPRCKSLAGKTSSTGRALPSRVASTAEEVQGDEYFEMEDIRDWRQGEEGREYLVKWAGAEEMHCAEDGLEHAASGPHSLKRSVGWKRHACSLAGHSIWCVEDLADVPDMSVHRSTATALCRYLGSAGSGNSGMTPMASPEAAEAAPYALRRSGAQQSHI